MQLERGAGPRRAHSVRAEPGQSQGAQDGAVRSAAATSAARLPATPSLTTPLHATPLLATPSHAPTPHVHHAVLAWGWKPYMRKAVYMTKASVMAMSAYMKRFSSGCRKRFLRSHSSTSSSSPRSPATAAIPHASETYVFRFRCYLPSQCFARRGFSYFTLWCILSYLCKYWEIVS